MSAKRHGVLGMGRWLSVCLVSAVWIGLAQCEPLDWPGFGPIEGTTTLSRWTNKLIYQYQGIPFAEPPTGNLRFKPPVKYADTWTEVRNFSSFGPICYQGSGLNISITLPIDLRAAEQSEDCLTLNVYTTKLTGGGNLTGLPVMVYIHGGQFRGGSAIGLGPEHYLDKEDMVLVVPQYRLGPIGFLSLKTAEVPGNQGMLDMVMALEWVRDNIEYFGGSPDRITICGQSAGAAAVTLLLFTPLLPEGLIKGVIAQSGSALGTWVPDPDPEQHTKEIGILAGCVISTPAILTACLRGKPANRILLAHNLYLGADLALRGGRLVGGNHIVYGENGDKSFLPDDPAVLFQKGLYKKVPLMAGVTKHEGSDFIALMYEVLNPAHNLFEPDTTTSFLSNTITRWTLGYGGIEDRTGFVSGFVQDKYFGDGDLGNFTAMAPGLIDILGVALLKACSFTFAKGMSRHTDTYLYSFNYFGEHSTFANTGRYPFNGGISHTDDLIYLFPWRELNERDDAIAQRMTEFWTSFVKDLKPVSKTMLAWPKLTTSSGPYMKIEPTWKVMPNFMEEYMIADKEGMTEPVDKGSASALQVSIMAISLTYFVTLFN